MSVGRIGILVGVATVVGVTLIEATLAAEPSLVVRLKLGLAAEGTRAVEKTNEQQNSTRSHQQVGGLRAMPSSLAAAGRFLLFAFFVFL